MKRAIYLTPFFIVLNLFVFGQTTEKLTNDSLPFYNMSLEELMKVNVTVASEKPMTARESPGIVTIITQDEILKSGATDLMQVLQQVPGFDLGVDVEGVIGLGVRGNWAHEGKVLLMWDGIKMNEDLYSTLQFGGHYPLSQIKRIEIIRGPGSAIYGGNAEYAVINIITINNNGNNGIAAEAVYSHMAEATGSKSIALSGGTTAGTVHLNAAAYLNESIRSDRRYQDNFGESYDMASNSPINSGQYRLDATWKGLSVIAMYDDYCIGQRDGYEEIYSKIYKTTFKSAMMLTKYDFKKGKFSFTPGIKYKYTQPWNISEDQGSEELPAYNTTENKKEFFVHSGYDPTSRVNIIGGMNFFVQDAKQNIDSSYFFNGTENFSMNNYAAYLQSIIKLNAFNFIIGCRFNDNQYYKSSFVPRIGVTRVSSQYHIKALFSKAFRAPSVENINASPDIKPENTTVAEFEAGIKLTGSSYITANIFDITTLDPIVYYYDSDNIDRYKNESPTGSRGVEIEYKYKSRRGYMSANYSFYTTAGHPTISNYEVPGHKYLQLAFPAHKINFSASTQITKDVSINPSLNYQSERYYVFIDGNDELVAERLKPVFYLNLNFVFENVIVKDLSVMAGCMNILNKEKFYIQPYNSNHAPLPGATTEYVLRIHYKIKSKK
jgi:outer membrane cobalamin receptor